LWWKKVKRLRKIPSRRGYLGYWNSPGYSRVPAVYKIHSWQKTGHTAAKLYPLNRKATAETIEGIFERHDHSGDGAPSANIHMSCSW
jgi:hypothetical protein